MIEAGWRGYAGQKNWAAEQAAHEWILSLDADEALSEALEAEIWNLKKSGPRFDAYTMPRLARYLGRWIYHSGWYPDRKIRLYDRRKATWVGDFVHESVRSQGTDRRPGKQHPPLHLRFALRASQDARSLYHPRGAGTGGQQSPRAVVEPDL